MERSRSTATARRTPSWWWRPTARPASPRRLSRAAQPRATRTTPPRHLLTARPNVPPRGQQTPASAGSAGLDKLDPPNVLGSDALGGLHDVGEQHRAGHRANATGVG